MAEWEVGDVVRLKSGGPKMTVSEVAPGGNPDQVECRWFRDGESKTDYFRTEELQSQGE